MGRIENPKPEEEGEGEELVSSRLQGGWAFCEICWNGGLGHSLEMLCTMYGVKYSTISWVFV